MQVDIYSAFDVYIRNTEEEFLKLTIVERQKQISEFLNRIDKARPASYHNKETASIEHRMQIAAFGGDT